MCQLVRDGRKNLEIRAKAADLVQSLPAKKYIAEICYLFGFVRDNIRYTRDIRGVETLHFPEQVLAQGYGDCDDKAVLLASLLEAIGHKTRFVALSFEPLQFSHVILETKHGDNWMSLDATEPHPMGWRPPGIVNYMIAHVTNGRN